MVVPAARVLGLVFVCGLIPNTIAQHASARVEFATTEGTFIIEVHSEWAPRAAAKVWRPYSQGQIAGLTACSCLQHATVSRDVPGPLLCPV
eukprot:SAG11_NODE_184_length_13162_cov_9.151803_7_plen_91_part_00